MSKSFEEIGARADGRFGERLRREREMRGISLDEISAATKIGTRLLRALEDEQFDLLPGGIFNKGYVRAYARHVGIDEEQAVADYLKAAGETPPMSRLIAHQNASARDGPYLQQRLLSREFPCDSGAHPAGGDRRRRGRLASLPAAATGSRHVQDWRCGCRTAEFHKSDTLTLNPSASAGSGQTGQRCIPRNGRRSTSASELDRLHRTRQLSTVRSCREFAASGCRNSDSGTVASSGHRQRSAPFEVTVRAKDRAWVEIKSDGKVLVRGVIKPPDVKTIHATNKVVFWTGNAGEVELSFNGKNVPLTGGENDEQVLVFNSRGLLPRPAAQ